jgi:protoheme IX farnesyltransferase
MSATIKNYLLITKPGILFGNLISVMGGFFLAAKGSVDITLLVLTTAGICLVIASSCVVNNCLDRDLDRMMARTCDRSLAKGLVSPTAAMLYALLLGMSGMALLLAETNALTLVIVLSGFGIYVVIYTIYLKRHSVYAPLIGSLAGAAPPLAGYCAASGRFDMGALILLVIFSLWQMPHFYAIAIYRLDDYAAAAIPVFPVVRGVPTTKRHMIAYLLAFILSTMMLTIGGYTGYRYLAVILILGLVWLSMAWGAYNTSNDRPWAKKMFAFSVLTIFALNVMMSIDFARPVVPQARSSYVSQVDVMGEPGFEQSRAKTTNYIIGDSEALGRSGSDQANSGLKNNVLKKTSGSNRF